MNDHGNGLERLDAKIDGTLKNAFGTGPELSADFEERVMAGIRPLARARRRRPVYLIMMVYWSLVGAISGWIAFSYAGLPALIVEEFVGALMVTLALTLVPVWLALRLAGLTISELFINTIRR